MSSTVQSVVRKEVREITRDGRLRLLGFFVLILALAAIVFGAQQTHRAAEAREHASENAQDQWTGQGDKNPHVAAHYGTYVFAPTSVATAIDPGVSVYLGRSVKIEAHKRNLATHSVARDGSGLGGSGQFSVAMVLLQLVPLLIIAVGYGMWVTERERGTLRQLLSTGVRRGTLMWGKALALLIVIGALLIPAALVILGVLWMLSGGDVHTLVRLTILSAAYGVYFATFGALTLFASAMAPSSRMALVAMVGIWGLFCLVIPRVGAEFAEQARPLPSQAQLQRSVAASLLNGVDGKTDKEATIEAIASDLMAEQGLADAGMLVDNSFLTGFELQAESQWEDTVYDHHVKELDNEIAAQERFATYSGIASPYVAMRALSAGLCGTDFAHHRHFTDHAELWRKSLVAQLNEDFANNAGDKGWDYRADTNLWKNAPAFEYRSPGIYSSLSSHINSVVALLCWLLFSVILAAWSVRRMKVV